MCSGSVGEGPGNSALRTLWDLALRILYNKAVLVNRARPGSVSHSSEFSKQKGS